MLEKIFEYLQKQGLLPEYNEKKTRINFKYQMASFVIFSEEDDERFLNVTLPNIYSVDENNRYDVLEAINTVNDGTKLVKLYIYNNSVWVGVEQMLDTSPVLDDIIPTTIKRIYDGRERFYNALKNL